MKAKIKATGQIIELCPYVYDIDGNDILLDEVELLDNPNWQQVRIQAAIAAMNGYQSAPIIPGCDPNPSQQEVAKWSVQLADALIAELQERRGR